MRGPRLHEGGFSTVGRAGRLSVHTLGTCPRCEGRNPSFLHAARLSAAESEHLSDLTLVFLTRPGCHLCDQARPLVEEVCARLGLALEERNIEDDLALGRVYGERVPVALIGGVAVGEGVIDSRRRLLRAVKKALRRT